MTRQQLCRRLAHMADAERVDEAVERYRAPLVDRVEQLPDADPAEPVDVFELQQFRCFLTLLQREYVGRCADLQSRIFRLEEEVDLLCAQPFDVIGTARDEMLQVFGCLRTADEAAGAAGDRIELAGLLVLLAHRMTAADRAFLRKLIGLGIRRPLFHDHVENLRDDVAGTLHDDRVADADVVIVFADPLAGIADALDIILVMQRRVGNDHAADGDRGQSRHRCQRAGAADLDVDILDRRERLLGGEFVGRRPARRARAETEARLQIEPVDLVDDTVDIIVEFGTLKADLAVMAENILERIQPLHQRIDRETPVLEGLHHLVLRGRQIVRLGHLSPGIGEEFQLAAGRHLGIELAQ